MYYTNVISCIHMYGKPNNESSPVLPEMAWHQPSNIEDVCFPHGLAPWYAAIEASGNPGAANAIFRFLEPGYRFLLKWAPVFFTPALVTLGRDF